MPVLCADPRELVAPGMHERYGSAASGHMIRSPAECWACCSLMPVRRAEAPEDDPLDT